ncbi:MAG: 50S ribosomal protein L18 [Candidatus Bathyarchaeia archaeon]|nr:50S ribosomal protein L18 [Candidatus Bathyarchaeota archaeon]
MAKGSRYNLPYRRRREGKTDYRRRMRLILSGKPRFVVRASNKYVIVQVVEARIEGDRVLASAHSKELTSKYGWRGGCGNTPAAYLTGLLAGSRALKSGVSEAILDIGVRRATRGAKVFAALKGGLDAGLEIPHSDEVIPSLERIRGEHVAGYAKLLSETPELYEERFSQYLRNGLKPEDLPSHFEEVKSKIMEGAPRLKEA